MGGGKPPVPENMRGTLTLSDYKSTHMLCYSRNLNKQCATATIKQLEPLIPKNYHRLPRLVCRQLHFVARLTSLATALL
jgi:hypothetical protein